MRNKIRALFALMAIIVAPLAVVACSSTNTISVSSIASDIQLVTNGLNTIVTNSQLLSSISDSDKEKITTALASVDTVLTSVKASASGELTTSVAQGYVTTVETNVNTILSVVTAASNSGVFKESDTFKEVLTAINVVVPAIETAVNLFTAKAVMHDTATMTINQARGILTNYGTSL